MDYEKAIILLSCRQAALDAALSITERLGRAVEGVAKDEDNGEKMLSLLDEREGLLFKLGDASSRYRSFADSLPPEERAELEAVRAGKAPVLGETAELRVMFGKYEDDFRRLAALDAKIGLTIKDSMSTISKSIKSLKSSRELMNKFIPSNNGVGTLYNQKK